MRARIQRIIYVTTIFIFAVILLLAGGLLGMQNERERLKQQEQAEIVTDIAVVNLDEGIYEEGKRVYYSTALMDLEADYLVSENLEAARQGILNGSYAAYILIPSEFSQNATSINSVPEKAVLEFAINPNLREDVSRLTMSNVKNFEISLNTNMSYMYVQALLSEFHTAQNMSGTILKNDNTETQRLLAIDAEALLVEPEYAEMEKVDPEIKEVDFEAVFEKNKSILESVYSNYEGFVQDGQEAVADMKEKELTIAEGMEELYESISEVDIRTDEEDNIVYEEGLTAMDGYLQTYNTQFDNQLKLVKTMAAVISGEEEMEPGGEEESDVGDDGTGDTGEGDGEETGGGGTETQPEEGTEEQPGIEDILGEDFKPVTELIKDNIRLSLENANTTIVDCNAANAQKIEDIKTDISEWKESLIEQSADESIIEKLENLESEIDEIQETPELTIENTFDEAVALEPFTKLKEEIDKIEKVETQEYEAIFEEQVLTPLEEEISQENENIQKAGVAFMTPLEEYMMELTELDLYSFYDQEKMDALMDEFGDNIFEMEDELLETHGEYEDLVDEAIDYANEIMETHQQNLEEAYENTTLNVGNEVNLAIRNREIMNEVNSEILVSFREKLPYTRIGQLEYVQAYDFMVKPLKMTDSSITKDRTLIWQDYDFLRNVLIVLIICWCFSIAGIMFLKMKAYAETDRDKE